MTLIDDEQDVYFADSNPQFNNVVHIFRDNLAGIRAAAGYLPGHKVALPSHDLLTVDSIQHVLSYFDSTKISVVVFHGWSRSARTMLHEVRREFSKRVQITAVWHGNTAQFCSKSEFASVGELVKLRRGGLLDRLGSIKPDLNLLDDAFSPRFLLNVGPTTDLKRSLPNCVSSALLPMHNVWRKNYFTNLYAACAAKIKTIYVTRRPECRIHIKPRASIKLVPDPAKSALLSLIQKVDIITNATLSECQPMIALEGLSLRVPCVTGALSLGKLDRHPYQRLVQIAAVDTIGAVARAIRDILTMETAHPDELADLMADYDAKLRVEAYARWEEFMR